MRKLQLHILALLLMAVPALAQDNGVQLPYQLVQTRICELWNKPLLSDKRPIIAIIDTGVETDHPDLLGNIWTNYAELNGTPGVDDDNNGYIDDYNGWNFSSDTNDITDTSGHGTICSAIAAGSGKINPQALGANPNALIMPLKVNGGYKNFSNDDIIAAINYAINNGADVISMSFGTTSHSAALHNACMQASQKAVLVSSAGNESAEISESFQLPAAYPEVIAVEASDRAFNLCRYSDYDNDGPHFATQHNDTIQYNYELRAPGDSIFSATCNSDYTISSGTSMAGALVAGAVSRLIMVKDYKSSNGNINIAQLKADLIASRHTNNDVVDFLAAYNNTKAITAPAVTLTPRNVEAYAGLSVHLTPLLQNIGESTTKVTLHYSCLDNNDAQYLTLPNDDTIYGPIANGIVRLTPVNIGISSNCPHDKRLRVMVTATTDQGQTANDILTISAINTVGIHYPYNLEQSSSQTVYNLSGQRVTPNYSGIVIINGKKYVR